MRRQEAPRFHFSVGVQNGTRFFWAPFSRSPWSGLLSFRALNPTVVCASTGASAEYARCRLVRAGGILVLLVFSLATFEATAAPQARFWSGSGGSVWGESVDTVCAEAVNNINVELQTWACVGLPDCGAFYLGNFWISSPGSYVFPWDNRTYQLAGYYQCSVDWRVFWIQRVVVYDVCPECGLKYVIRLSRGDGSSADNTILASIEPGEVTTSLRATVYDDNNQPVPNVNVRLEVTVEANSGGHLHDVNRPKGTVNPAEGNTGADGSGHVFAFTAPAPAGDFKITASCLDRACKPEGPDEIWVGYKDLVDIPSSSDYALTEIVAGQTRTIGASDEHPVNHYLTQEALERLAIIARAYREQYPTNPVLHLNDASLERGGVYDFKLTWRKPHQCHSRGYDIDVRANQKPGAIPLRDRVRFSNFLRSIGIPVGHEYQGSDNEHFHLYLLTGGCEP